VEQAAVRATPAPAAPPAAATSQTPAAVAKPAIVAEAPAKPVSSAAQATPAAAAPQVDQVIAKRGEEQAAVQAKPAPAAPPATAKPKAARGEVAPKKVEPRANEAASPAMPGLDGVVARAPAPVVPMPVTVPPLEPALDKPFKVGARRSFLRRIGTTRLSFLLAVIVPVVLLCMYYLFISSDQYRSEMRFAVRGTERSTLENLGLNALTGSSSQAADAYIVIDYIHSKQVLLDMQQKLGIDVRQFFSRPDIDFAYRIEPDMPLEKFIYYWRWMVDASYNSTTSITTFEVTAFDGRDAAAIAQAVLKVS
jgi:capsular polysaccharide transport system permease protein